MVRMRVRMERRMKMKVDVEGGVRVEVRMGMGMRMGNGWWAMNVLHILLTPPGGSGRKRTKDLSDDLRAYIP